MAGRFESYVTSTRPRLELSVGVFFVAVDVFLFVEAATGLGGARREPLGQALSAFAFLLVPTSYFWVRGIRGLRTPPEVQARRREQMRERNRNRQARYALPLKMLQILSGACVGLLIAAIALTADGVHPPHGRWWARAAVAIGGVLAWFFGRTRSRRLRRRGYGAPV
jgi:membrane protein implicated in regulation of membrane protease activity